MEGAFVVGEAAKVSYDGALIRTGGYGAEDGDHFGVFVDSGRVCPAEGALGIKDVEAMWGSGGGGNLDEKDFAAPVSVNVLDQPTGTAADIGTGVGAGIEWDIELGAPAFVALVIEGRDDAAVDEEAGDLGAGEEAVVLGEVVGQDSQEEEGHDPEGCVEDVGVAPPGLALFAGGGPAEELVRVGGDMAMRAWGAPDGEAGVTLPDLDGADAGIEEGSDLLPGVKGAAGGSRWRHRGST